MTNTIWTNPVSGNWSTAADWSAGVPVASENAVIDTKGPYTIAISSDVVANSLTMDAAGATLSEAAGGSLTMKGKLTLDAGVIILDGVNNFGGPTRLIGGELELGNAAALGSSSLTMDGGILAGLANISLANEIDASGTFAFAAGHGDTFTLAGQTILNMNGGGFIIFGTGSQNGTVVWDPLTFGFARSTATVYLDVKSGTLRDGNGSLTKALSAATSTNISAGATLDIHGHSETVKLLNGGGVVTSSVSGGVLNVVNGIFASIQGSIALVVDQGLTLTGASNYTGGTTIDSGAKFTLENSASIGGNIKDNGILTIDAHANTDTLGGAISGSGSLVLDSGTLILNGANTYGGGTTVNGGTLEIGNAAALGTGAVTSVNGTFVATTTEILSNQLIIDSTATFQAAHGTTLTLNAGAGWTIDRQVHLLQFGSSLNDGEIIWDTAANSSREGSGSIVIVDGTLQAGDSNFQTLLDFTKNVHKGAGHVDVEAGAALDVAGFASTIYNITGNGTIENSGTSTTVTLNNGNFSGDFSGPIVLDVVGHNIALSGDAANWSAINLLSHTILDLEGASSSAMVFSPGGFEKLSFDDFPEFTGTVSGFASSDWMMFPNLGTGLTVTYSGTTVGGTLTVSDADTSAQITMVGDYTGGTFGTQGDHVFFTPNIALTSADSFEFSGGASTHVVPETNVLHLHGGYSSNEIALAHNVPSAMHAHGFEFDHFAHQLFAYEHALMAEALH